MTSYERIKRTSGKYYFKKIVVLKVLAFTDCLKRDHCARSSVQTRGNYEIRWKRKPVIIFWWKIIKTNMFFFTIICTDENVCKGKMFQLKKTSVCAAFEMWSCIKWQLGYLSYLKLKCENTKF